MKKSVHSEFGRLVAGLFRDMRAEAGLTQRQFAARLGREHNLVVRIELGERRVDLPEFYQLVEALGGDPKKEATRLMAEFQRISREKGNSSRKQKHFSKG